MFIFKEDNSVGKVIATTITTICVCHEPTSTAVGVSLVSRDPGCGSVSVSKVLSVSNC